MNRDIEGLLTWFNREQKLKLEQNQHKPHWREEGIWKLFDGLMIEVNELGNAIAYEGPEEIRKEAADVANFAAFIADQAEECK